VTIDVKTRITVDDSGASDSLDRIKRGFSELSDARDQAQQGMSWFGQTLSTLVATQLPQVLSRVAEFGRGLIEAGENASSADQALGGLIATVQGIPWAEARGSAQDWGDTIDQIAMETRQNIDDMGDAFELLVELGEATPEGLKKSADQLSQLGTIANVLGKDTKSITMEFAMMGEGMLRSRGQMAQLLQSTGIFGKDMKKAASYWATLKPEKRQELLAKGLASVAQNMSKATPTFRDYATEVSNFYTMAKEKVGEGLTKAMTPHLAKLANYLERNAGKLDDLADYLEKDFGKVAEGMGESVKEAFEWIVKNKEELAKDIKEAWQFAKDVVGYIINNRDTIMKMAAVYGATKIGGGALQSGLGKGATEIGKMAYSSGAAGIGSLTGVAGGIVGLAAFSAAIVGVGLAADQATKLIKEAGKSDAEKNADAQRKYLEDASKSFEEFSKAEIAQLDHVTESFKLNAEAIGMTGREANDFAKNMWKLHGAARAQVAPFEQAARSIENIKQRVANDPNGIPQGMGAQAIAENINQMTALMQTAIDTQNQGALTYMAKTLANSKGLRDTFINSAMMTEQGFSSLADVVENMGPQFADFAKDLRDRAAGEAAVNKLDVPKQVVNFNGGQTFKINQDFRNQDPDRIAVVFQRDITAAATKRIQANTSSPFGA